VHRVGEVVPREEDSQTNLGQDRKGSTFFPKFAKSMSMVRPTSSPSLAAVAAEVEQDSNVRISKGIATKVLHENDKWVGVRYFVGSSIVLNLRVLNACAFYSVGMWLGA
jgi:hypothetical protein